MSKIPDDYWPCACVRHDKNGNLSQIKAHPPTTRVCRVCKCKQPEPGWQAMEAREREHANREAEGTAGHRRNPVK